MLKLYILRRSFLSEYPNLSHNFTNLGFVTSSLLFSNGITLNNLILILKKMYGIQKGELLFSSWVLNTGRNYNLVTNDSSINVELNYELD